MRNTGISIARIGLAAALVVSLLGGCAGIWRWQHHTRHDVLAVFDRPRSLQALFLNCVMDSVAQGLSADRAALACSGRVDDRISGATRDVINAALPSAARQFNPLSVQAACSSTDPRVANEFDGLSDDEVEMLMDDAKDRRTDAAEAHDRAAEEHWDREAHKAFDELNRRQQSQGPCPECVAGRTPLESVCAEVLQEARDLLAECTRRGWKGGGCAALGARLNHCPDPAYAYIDPDGANITCAAAPDPQAVRDAYRAQCQRNTDGGTACDGVVGPEGVLPLYGSDGPGICNDPQAYISPDSDTCVMPLTVARVPGSTDLQTVILIGANRFGGPFFVLPKTGPSPFPWGGGDPAPGRRDRTAVVR